MRFREAVMKRLDAQQFAPVITYAKRFEANAKRGKGLFLSGRPGIGKSYAVAALIRAAQEHHTKRGRYFDFEFVTAADLFDRVPLWVNGHDGKEGEVDKRRNQSWSKTYAMVPWLVVNDLGKEFKGGAMKDQVTYKLGRVLRERHERKLVVHVTTNLTVKDTREEYGDSISSLLSEMCLVYEITGKDRRRQQ